MAYKFSPAALYDTFSPNCLKDRVAIITGGGTGIGKGITLEFAKVGANVVVASRNLENLERTVQEVKALGRRAIAVRTDIRSREMVRNCVERTLEEFGKIDILVNNAAGRFDMPSENMSEGGWNAVVNIVLNGTWNMTQEVGKVMIRQGGGNIINIISNSPWLGQAYSVHSASAKSGVLGMTKSLASEWGKYNIRINGIAPLAAIERQAVDRSSMPAEFQGPGAPGAFGRNLPLSRVGTVQEMAWVAIFLASDASSYVSGTMIDATGASWLGRMPQRREPADTVAAAESVGR